MFSDTTTPPRPTLAAPIRAPMDDELTAATSFRPLSPQPVPWPAQTTAGGQKQNRTPTPRRDPLRT